MDIDTVVKEMKAKLDKFEATLEAHTKGLDKRIDDLTGDKTAHWFAGVGVIGLVVGYILGSV